MLVSPLLLLFILAICFPYIAARFSSPVSMFVSPFPLFVSFALFVVCCLPVLCWGLQHLEFLFQELFFAPTGSLGVPSPTTPLNYRRAPSLPPDMPIGNPKP